MEQLLYELKNQVDVVEQMLVEIKEYGVVEDNLESTLKEIGEMQKNIIAAQFLYEAEGQNELQR